MQKRKHGPIRFSPVLAGVVIFGPRDPLGDRHGTVSVIMIDGKARSNVSDSDRGTGRYGVSDDNSDDDGSDGDSDDSDDNTNDNTINSRRDATDDDSVTAVAVLRQVIPTMGDVCPTSRSPCL